MGIDRRLDGGVAGLHIREEREQLVEVVALREAFAVEHPARFQHFIGIKEAVGRHEIDAPMARPARKQRPQHAGRGAFSRRHASGQAEHERHLAVPLAQKGFGRAMQPLRRLDVEVEQAAERQIDLDHFLGGNLLGQTA